MNPLESKPFIIADIGSNHRNSFDLALRQIDAASECGVSAVKFQLFTYEELYGLCGKHEYELPREWIPALAARCRDKSVHFMCTAFSPEGIDFIDPHVQVHKLASSEMNHVVMLERLASTKKPLIISTGGSTALDVHNVVALLKMRKSFFCLLECIGAYPAKICDYDLNSMLDFKANLIGVSDHTRRSTLAIAAVGTGATVFEKHFDLLWGYSPTPDSDVSIGTQQLKEYCLGILHAFSAMGTGIKRIHESEREMATRHKRRLKVIKPVRAGEKLVFGENFGIYRSLVPDERALPPSMWQVFHGTISEVDLKPGDGLEPRI